jgi:tRNA 2-thiouridine synthesizing protein C
LDIAFAAAVFERPLNYIFIGDGVYQLLSKQDPEAIKNKPHGAALETLELYGIDEVYVHRNSLVQRDLSEDEFVCKVTLIDDCTLKQLVAESIHVINL